jgi:hypothetical protein
MGGNFKGAGSLFSKVFLGSIPAIEPRSLFLQIISMPFTFFDPCHPKNCSCASGERYTG